jgi:hypothetical protein
MLFATRHGQKFELTDRLWCETGCSLVAMSTATGGMCSITEYF